MKLVLVDGFRGPHALSTTAREVLESRGHAVSVIDLHGQGFDRYMNADERRVYHDTENLITPETAASAELVRATDGLLVVTELIAGAISPVTKSWFERVFIPGVSFTFTRGGRVTGALGNLRRIGMIVDCPDGVAGAEHRKASTRSVLRGARMNASRWCRTTYLVVGPDDDPGVLVRRALSRW